MFFEHKQQQNVCVFVNRMHCSIKSLEYISNGRWNNEGNPSRISKNIVHQIKTYTLQAFKDKTSLKNMFLFKM